jgi:hypothetical protein
MKFAKVVFWTAGVWGLAVLTPLYFLFDAVGRTAPPAVTHPEFYYGFIAVAVAWQFAFLVIGTYPERFRPMMILAAIEKGSYVLTLVVLYGQHRLTLAQSIPIIPDGLLCALFLIAFWRTSDATGS